MQTTILVLLYEMTIADAESDVSFKRLGFGTWESLYGLYES